MKKRVILMLVVLALCVCTVIPVFATTEKPTCVLDYAQVLTESEVETLENKLDAISEKFSVQVAVLTVEACGEQNHANYAKAVYQKYGYGLGENKDGILLLIDMDEENRGWYIYGKGLGSKAMTDSEIENVGNAISPDLSDGDYVAVFNTFAQRCEARIDIAINGEPFKPVMSLVISLVIGFVLSLIITGVMRGKLKSVRPQRAATNYVRSGSMNVTESYELFLYRTVERKEKPKSSSSSSSGSGESGGGGSF